MEFKENGIRVNNFHFDDEMIDKLQATWKYTVNNMDPYPEDKFNGKGIVLTAGGSRYSTCAWIAIKIIRKVGCNLPIELWYKGNEISQNYIEEIENLNVKCKNFVDHCNEDLVGFALKPLAILKSCFREILFIDADNNCVKDPTILFDLKEYKEHGAVFWPDFWHTSKDNSIWKIVESRDFHVPEQESGQILIDKKRCWEELNLCMHFNLFSKYYYQLLLGDKDTFRFAWLAIDSSFHMVDIPVGTCGFFEANEFYGRTMVQHHPNGEIYFLHRNLLKWDVTKNNEFIWKKIIRFLPKAKDKRVYLRHPHRKSYYIELKGDTEVISFEQELGSYENICQSILKEWRESNVYKSLVEYLHLAKHRYPDDASFSFELIT